ncbi:hypothetical protein J6590_092375 [Homalodisca vitripennis]|nr:hypothetical protein J6590_092375 [Homalodisca vitripennis]
MSVLLDSVCQLQKSSYRKYSDICQGKRYRLPLRWNLRAEVIDRFQDLLTVMDVSLR